MTASTTRPVILTVDDDPGVSRSIARDLRRRYAEENRIVRAENPAQALDALKELKLRGEPVALLLADYRCPRCPVSSSSRPRWICFPSPAACC
jgi:thioredoxin reductase (NADPH)